jgi:hypothetical protein
VGNKKDLQKQRQVSQEEARSFAGKNGLFFFETSAKEDDQPALMQIFVQIIEQLGK